MRIAIGSQPLRNIPARMDGHRSSRSLIAKVLAALLGLFGKAWVDDLLAAMAGAPEGFRYEPPGENVLLLIAVGIIAIETDASAIHYERADLIVVLHEGHHWRAPVNAAPHGGGVIQGAMGLMRHGLGAMPAEGALWSNCRSVA